jgi:hypothetical protein
MKVPFRRKKPLPERLIDTAAAGAGKARLLLKQRSLRPHRG